MLYNSFFVNIFHTFLHSYLPNHWPMLVMPIDSLTHSCQWTYQCQECLCIVYVLPMICMLSESMNKGPYVHTCITCKKEARRRTHGQFITDKTNEKWPMNITFYEPHHPWTNFITVNICWKKKYQSKYIRHNISTISLSLLLFARILSWFTKKEIFYGCLTLILVEEDRYRW